MLLPGQSHGWRSLVGCSPWGRKESDTTERLHFHLSLSCIGEGNGNPLQCSCLENLRDRGAWWVPSMGSHRVRHDWSDLAAAAALIYQKKARQWLFSVVYRVHHTYWRAQCRFWRPNDSSNWVTNRLKSGQPLLPFLERCRRKPSAAVNYRVRTQLR